MAGLGSERRGLAQGRLTTGQELRRGWPILVCMFLVTAVAPTTILGLVTGIFLPVLENEFGWSRAMLASGITVFGIVCAILSPPVGALADRIGARAMLPAALVLSAGCFWLLGGATKTYAVFLGLHIALGFAAVACSTLITSRILAGSFDRARGTALGLGLGGMGLANMFVPSFSSGVVDAVGWRGAYGAIGAVLFVVAAIVVIPVWRHDRAAQKSVAAAAAAAGGQAQGGVGTVLRAPIFWVLTMTFFLIQTAVAGLPVHFVSMLVDAGSTRGDAAAMAGLIGLSLLISRLLTGVALDWAPARLVGMTTALVSAAGLLAMALGGTTLAPLGAIALGLTLGAEADLAAYLVSRYFPKGMFGRAYGLLYPSLAAGAIVSAQGYGLWYDAAQSYTPALIAASIGLAAAALIFVFLPPYSSDPEQAEEGLQPALAK
jgi:predicted MFS family arabinose efflux permease